MTNSRTTPLRLTVLCLAVTTGKADPTLLISDYVIEPWLEGHTLVNGLAFGPDGELYGYRHQRDEGAPPIVLRFTETGEEVVSNGLDALGEVTDSDYMSDLKWDSTPSQACGGALHLSFVDADTTLFQGLHRLTSEGSPENGLAPEYGCSSPPLAMASSTAAGPDGTDAFYIVTDLSPPRLERIRCATGERDSLGGGIDLGIDGVYKMTVDPNGNFGGRVFLTSRTGIVEFDPAASWEDTWFVAPPDPAPASGDLFWDLDFAPGGPFGTDLFVTNPLGTSLESYDPAGNRTLVAIGFRSELTPEGRGFRPHLAFSGDGSRLFVADADAIWVIRPDENNLTVDIDCCGPIACPGGTFVYQLTASNGSLLNGHVRVSIDGVGIPNGSQTLLLESVIAGESRDWVRQVRIPPSIPNLCPTTLTLTAEIAHSDRTVVATHSCSFNGIELTD